MVNTSRGKGFNVAIQIIDLIHHPPMTRSGDGLWHWLHRIIPLQIQILIVDG